MSNPWIYTEKFYLRTKTDKNSKKNWHFQVDSEGYTIRKPERKESSASSSGWSSDEDGKPDTYKIKVNIRPAEEAAPISTDQG